MLGRILLILGSIWLGRVSIWSAREFVKKGAISCQRIRGEDKISDCQTMCWCRFSCMFRRQKRLWLPWFCQTMDVLWTMVPLLKILWDQRERYPKDVLVVYLANSFAKELKKSIWWFLNKLMWFHKAPLLYRLILELGPHCPLDVGVEIRNWIVRFVNYGSISCGLRSLLACPNVFIYAMGLCLFTLAARFWLSFLFQPASQILDYSIVYKDEDSLVLSNLSYSQRSVCAPKPTWGWQCEKVYSKSPIPRDLRVC